MNTLLRPRCTRALLLAVVLGSDALAIPRFAAADDFSDFRIPSNRSLLWNIGLGGRLAGQEVGYPGTENAAGSLDGNIATRMGWFSDTDPALTSFSVDVQAQGLRSHRTSEVQSPGFSDSDETTSRQVFERWSLAGVHRRYPWAMPLGFEVLASFGGDYSQRWESMESQNNSVASGTTTITNTGQDLEYWTYVHSILASAGAGWGRVRNATGVYDALVLEQRLRETGAITRPLSTAGRQRLAEVLYLRGSLGAVHDRPGRVLWREIDRVLSEDGALAEGGLDPYSVLRAAEPHTGAAIRLTEDGVPVSPVTRMAGSFAGVRITDFHSNVRTRYDRGTYSEVIVDGIPSSSGSNSYSLQTNENQDDVEAGPFGEIHLPLGPPWQLDASASMMLGVRPEDSQLRLRTDASLAWLAADRWTAIANASYYWFDEDRTAGATGGDFWRLDAGMGVSWYVEDRTAIELSATHAQQWTRGDEPPTPGSFHLFYRTFTVTLAATYRFAGWIATPGFFTGVPAVR